MIYRVNFIPADSTDPSKFISPSCIFIFLLKCKLNLLSFMLKIMGTRKNV